MVLQPDGKLVIGGEFTNVLGEARNRIARLNTDGSLDTSFAPATIPSGTIWSLALQSDGRILAGGSFNNVNSYTRNRVARFRSNGTLDDSFDPGMGPNGTIYSVAVQPDGRPLIAGAFSSVNGFPRRGVARLNGDPPVVLNITFTPSFDPETGELTEFTLAWPAQTGRSYSLYISTNMIDWTVVPDLTTTGSEIYYTDADALSSACRFYRVRMDP
jgi:uncharacterized delta-60 repeat protein